MLAKPMSKDSIAETRKRTGSEWTWKPDFGVVDAEVGGDKGDDGDHEAGTEEGILVRIGDTINLQVANIHFVSNVYITKKR